ncbi:MAG: hypothetical protein E6Q61_00510 [Nitrosomonas sp.]|nr:MAG: hypothetical protein E6Q61_00510 [Nitrosomonas sp.]
MRNRSSLQTILTGLPVATASLYVLGICYYQGFLRIVGLEESQFPLTVDRTLFHGFFALLDLSAAQIGYFVLASEMIALVAVVIVALSTSKRVRNLIGFRSSNALTQENKIEALVPPKPLAEFADFASYMFLFSAIVLFSILGILVAGTFADKSGQAAAKSFLKRIEDGKQPGVDIFLAGQEQSVKGYSILCSTTHCAFVVNQKVVTYRHEKVERTIAHNTTVNTDAAR